VGNNTAGAERAVAAAGVARARRTQPCRSDVIKLSIAATDLKFAGVISRSGMVTPHADSTFNTMLTMSIDVRPASRRLSSGRIVRVTDWRARKSATIFKIISRGASSDTFDMARPV
jgi:hypothetical protein